VLFKGLPLHLLYMLSFLIKFFEELFDKGGMSRIPCDRLMMIRFCQLNENKTEMNIFCSFTAGNQLKVP